MIRVTFARGVVLGLVGGLVGTIMMDIVCIGAFLVVGLPAVVSFSTIGDTAAGFFSMIGLNMAGGVPLGTAMHYLIGPVLGVIFGAAVSQVDAFQVDSMKKGIVFGILYTQVSSQPILAAAPILLKMTVSETLQWFGVSFVMHLIWGVVLGIVVSYGLRLATMAKHS
jgi:hypothetical protein